MELPDGLEETIRRFFSGCYAMEMEADEISITLKMVEKLMPDFEKNKGEEWKKARTQLLAVAGLSGRLAGLHAQADGKQKIEWSHARLGLRDGKAECQEVLGATDAKHCLRADFERD